MKTNIAVFNSNPIQQERAQNAISAYNSSREVELHTNYFISGEEMLKDIKEHGGYEIYLIDIVKSEMEGMKLAENIRSFGDKGKIIMLNGQAANAWKAFKVNASNYLLQPVNREAFNKAMDIILEDIEEKHKSPVVEVKLNHGICRFRLDELIYAEVQNRVANYYFADGSVRKSCYLRGSFCKEVVDLLDLDGVLLLGHSLLINLKHVKVVDAQGISFSNGEIKTPPKYKYKEVDELWKEFLN